MSRAKIRVMRVSQNRRTFAGERRAVARDPSQAQDDGMDPRPLIYGLVKRAKNEVTKVSFEARRVRDGSYNDRDRSGKERVCGEWPRPPGQGGDAPEIAARASAGVHGPARAVLGGDGSVRRRASLGARDGQARA